MEIKLNLAGGDSRHKSRDVSAQARVNWIPEIQNYEGAVEQWVLVDAPGSATWLDTGAAGRCRGLYKAGNGNLYGVWGQTVYEIREVGGVMTATSRGDIASNNSPVYMADNGEHMALADGNAIWLHELGGSDDIAQASIPMTGPSHIVFLGGYLVVIATGGSLEERGRIWWSALYTATSWPALNYANAEGFSDPLLALAVRRGDLWLLGPSSYEVWSQTGDVNLPFSRVGASQTGFGCAAPNAVAVIGNEILWVGGSKAGADAVFMSAGYEAKAISDVTISQYLATASVGDAVSWTYQAEGHTYYLIDLSAEGTTLCFDLSTGRWHRRESKQDDGSFGAWDCRYAEYAFGRTLCGYQDGGLLVELVSDRTEADGKPVVRTFRSNPVISNGHPLMCRELRAYFDTGRASLGLVPQAMMRFSNDGGYTWSNTQWRDIGTTGAYSQPVSWQALGVGREWCFEIVVSADCDATLAGLFVEMDRGIGR